MAKEPPAGLEEPLLEARQGPALDGERQDEAAQKIAKVVEADDGAVRPGQGGDEEAHTRKEFPEVMLDLGDHPPRPVPGRGPIPNAPVTHQRGVARSAAWPGEQVLDGPFQDIVGWESKGRVGTDDHVLSPAPVPVNDGRSTLSHPSARRTLPAGAWRSGSRRPG
jgi:hypothetical protein